VDEEEPIDVLILFLSLQPTIIDGMVNPIVSLINMTTQLERVQIQSTLGVRGAEGVEFGVEHAYNFRALIVHNRLQLLVPQHGHCILLAAASRKK